MSFLVRFILFVFLVPSFLNTFVSPTQHMCNPDQRDALLEFRTASRIDSEISCYPKTESWSNNSDCCSWDGITCDAKSGNVIGLDLSTSCIQGRLESNSSLFKLRHLRDLNLAYNNFTASPIPTEFDKLIELERLNLSKSSFSGQIPTKLLQLTRLVSFDLSSFFQNSLSIDPSFLSLLAQNLRNLRDLDMSYLNLSSEIPHEFSTMWSLRSLHLEGCSLFGEFPNSVLLIPNLESIYLDRNRNLRGNLPVFRGDNSLQILSLFETSFSGTIPDSISNLKHLTYLDINFSNFSGRIPSSLGNLSQLSSLSLRGNHLIGEIPSSIGNLSHLSDLDLSSNNLIGEIPSSIGNLKQLNLFYVLSNKLSGNFPSALLNLTQLRDISLGSNQFTGFLPPNISQFSKLEYLNVGHNSFAGAIPSSLFKISTLTRIYLNHNHLIDLVGIENFSLLPNLQYLSLGDNNFMVSPVDLNVFSPLKKLETLSLSGIPISISYDSDFQSHLEYLYLSGCNITEFPKFIRNQRKLWSLDLSNNKIKGHVPDWLWSLPELYLVDLSENSLIGFEGSPKPFPGSKINTLDLSSNAFQGPIFIPSSVIYSFFGSKNNFTGEILQSICGQNSLTVLDLSNNNLDGSIPRCLETQMSSLSDLNLRNNSLSGSLPDIFMHAKELISLDVGQNQLEGNLPASLTCCSALQVLNVESNRFNGTFPFQLNSLHELQVLVLRSNKFHGRLHNADGVWFGFPQLQIIDVSHNQFFGTLPSDYFFNWTAISSKRDDYEILDYIRGDTGGYGFYVSVVLMSKGISMDMQRILKIYTAIDFSGNQLHGEIPDSLGLLKELRSLNLSGNAFTGHIPSSLGNLTNLESLDLSQNNLSGEIPPVLGNLYSLSWINVSHNQLVGSIPQGTQFQRQNCSSYEGNPGLFGPSLKDVCRDIREPTSQHHELPESSKEEEEKSFSLIAAGLGLVFGVVFGMTMGQYMFSYKHEWYMKTFGLRNTRTR